VPKANLPHLADFVLQAQALGRAMFSSHYSVGCARRGFEPGDEIFAIDGARSPFILRKSGSRCYRIVSGCYLWEALQLDCWNPGSNKGRLGANLVEAGQKQTRMIEIY
jgi:hypothetical protein